MKILSLLLLISVAGCTGSGPAYAGKAEGNLVVYRVSQFMYFAKDYSFEAAGEECSLRNGSYFVTTIKAPTEIAASSWYLAGTSRLRVKPGSYVRIEVKHDRMWGMAASGYFGGFVGQGTEQGLHSIGDDGPFILTLVPKAQAEKELQGLNRDCM